MDKINRAFSKFTNSTSSSPPSVQRPGPPLHEAARKYNDWEIRSLLKRREDRSLKDNEGRTALHVLLSEGFQGKINSDKVLQCAEILVIDDHGNVHLQDQMDTLGETPLSYAVQNGLGDCVKYLVEKGADTTARTKKYEKKYSLAQGIAKYMPDAMTAMLDNAVNLGEDKETVTLDWSFLLQKPKTQMSYSGAEAWSNKMRGQHDTDFLYEFLDVNLKDRHTYLTHPLVQAFMHFKEKRMSFYLALYQLVMVVFIVCYLAFLYVTYFKHCRIQCDAGDVPAINSTTFTPDMSTTAFFSTTDPPTTVGPTTVFPFIDQDLTTAPGNPTEPPKDEPGCKGSHLHWCPLTRAVKGCGAFLTLIAILLFLKEVYMWMRTDSTYFKNWSTWVTWLTLLLMCFTLWPTLQFHRDSYRFTWHYPVASLGAFFSGVLFVVHFELIANGKKYLEQVVKIFLAVLKIILLFVPIFTGFYVGFNINFYGETNLMTYILMTINPGSDAYKGKVTGISEDPEGRFILMANVFCGAFILIIGIVFINYVMAASIDDAAVMKQDAQTLILSKQVEKLFSMEVFGGSRFALNSSTTYTYNATLEKCKLPSLIREEIMRLLQRKLQQPDQQTKQVPSSENPAATQGPRNNPPQRIDFGTTRATYKDDLNNNPNTRINMQSNC